MANINEQLANRKLFSGMDESTYYTKELHGHACNNMQDPDLLFKIKIYGYYKIKYKWTKEQCDWFIENNIHESRGHVVKDVQYDYDWGAGENSVTNESMHKPHLDHILPKEQKGKDIPENMRIRVKRLNENKGNTNSDQERIATILDMAKDMEDVQNIQYCIDELKKRGIKLTCPRVNSAILELATTERNYE